MAESAGQEDWRCLERQPAAHTAHRHAKKKKNPVTMQGTVQNSKMLLPKLHSFSEVPCSSRGGPSSNSDLERLLQLLSSGVVERSNATPSLPPFTLVLSSSRFKISHKMYDCSFARSCSNLLHQRFLCAVFLSPFFDLLLFSIFLVVPSPALTGSGPAHLDGGRLPSGRAVLFSIRQFHLAITFVIAWERLKSCLYIQPVTQLNHLDSIISDISASTGLLKQVF